MALNWNTRIKSATANRFSLDDVMRELFRASRRKDFTISEKSIDDAAVRAYLKEGIQNDIEKFIGKGETIEPRNSILGDCFTKDVLEIAPFDAGFDIEATLKERIFRGVREDSSAYLAGMRNGQKWGGGGMERDPKMLAEFIVEESGTQKTIKYYPAGNNKTRVPQYKDESQRINRDKVICQNWFKFTKAK